MVPLWEIRGQTGEKKKKTIVTSLRIWYNKLNSTLNIMGKHPFGFCDQCSVKYLRL